RRDRRGDAGRPGGVRGGAPAAGGRRVVTRRGWAALIFVTWAASLGWLARRELFRSTRARLPDAALSVPPGAVDYRLPVAGQQVGFASSTIDTAASTIRVEDVLVLDVPALGVLHRTTTLSRATLSRTLRLQDLDTRFDGDLGRFSSHATVSGDTALAMWLVAGPDSEFTRVPLNRPIVLPTLLPLRLAFGEELKPGKTYSLRLFDPVLLAERDVAVTIAPESTLVVADSADYDSTAMAWVPVHFDTVRAFRIEQERGGVRASAWIDAAGHIVRVTSGGDGGFTMERSAFEIAYENFRRRDTARVARASASPRVGDIIATTALTAGARPQAAPLAGLLLHWVASQVAPNAAERLPSALQVLARRRGDCNEHTLLYVALARAVGLPAHSAAGLLLADGRFYYHAWAEVYLGDWVAVDPTF